MTVRTDRALRFTSKSRSGESMTDSEIVAYLHRHLDSALNDDDGGVSTTREELRNLFRGGPVGQESIGKSSFRTMEVYEFVQSMKPDILSAYFDADTPLRFRARTPEDQQRSKQETDVVNYFMFERDDSFTKMDTIALNALVDPVAYIKVYTDDSERTRHHKATDLSDSQLLDFTRADRMWKRDVKIEETVTPQGVRFSFSGTEIVNDKNHIVEPIPPDQMRVNRDAVHLDLDEVWRDYGFIAQVCEVTFTELVLRGYDREKLDGVAANTSKTRYGRERVGRMYREDERPDERVPGDASTRRFEVYECYTKMDIDGSGIADSWRIVMVNDTIFEKERVSYQPFVAVSLVPLSFKHVGMSPSESLAQIQELKTKLLRSTLDDIYRNEERRVHVDRTMLTPRTHNQWQNPANGMIEWKGNPHQAVRYEEPSTVVGENMPMIQYADDMKKMRAGVAPENALNPDVIRDATAHGMLAGLDSSTARTLHLARLFGEQCLKKIAIKLHTCLRMHQDSALVLQLRGKWVETTPTDWVERTSMTVRVGMGFQSREQRIAALQAMLQAQREAMAANLSSYPKIYHTLQQLAELSGLGFGVEYFEDPTMDGWKPPEPPPDAQMAAVQAQSAAVQAQEKTKLDLGKLKFEAEKRRDELEREKMALDRARIEADLKLKRIEAEFGSLMVVEQRAAEVELKRAQAGKTVAEIRKLGMDAASVAVDIDMLTRHESNAERKGTNETTRKETKRHSQPETQKPAHREGQDPADETVVGE